MPGPIQRITPVLRCDDALQAAAWYGRLGFEVTHVHQSGEGEPRFVDAARRRLPGT